MTKVKFGTRSICYKTGKSNIALSYEELPVCYSELHSTKVKSECIDRLHSTLSNDIGYYRWEIIYHCAALIQQLHSDIDWDWYEQIMNLKIEETQRQSYLEYIKSVAPLESNDPGLDEWWDKYNAWELDYVNKKTADVESTVQKLIIDRSKFNFSPVKYFSKEPVIDRV